MPKSPTGPTSWTAEEEELLESLERLISALLSEDELDRLVLDSAQELTRGSEEQLARSLFQRAAEGRLEIS